MMRITFKDVGQGDSIILEWDKDGKKKIGIIDCNKYLGDNPVLSYIINPENKVAKIEFLILSHPHHDHFSGFEELIRYCINHNIRINYFLHTSNNMPGFWKAAVDSKEAELAVIRLFQIIREAEIPCGMKRHNIQAEHICGPIKLGNEYSLELIAPTSEHLDYFAQNFVHNPTEEEAGNKPSANWLSTVIKIASNKHGGYVLLTSDANKDTLFYDKKEPALYKEKLILCQCPHHGSERNFKNSFWQLIKRPGKTPIVISVGPNTYGHPAELVVTDLLKNKYNIYSTNKIGYLASEKYGETVADASTHLSVFGSPVASSRIDRHHGDKTFDIDPRGNVVSYCG